MINSIILNEASLPFESIDACENNIQFFFDLLHEAKSKNISFFRADGVKGNWNQLYYADGFNFDKWLNSIKDRDRQRQIKSVICTLQCLSINNNDLDNILFSHKNNRDTEVQGLAHAHLNNSYSLSIASKNYWLLDTIPIIKVSYTNDVFHESSIDVPNIAKPQQLQLFLKNLEDQRTKNSSYITNLKVKDNEDFKNLLFTESFLKSVSSTTLQPLDFKQLISALQKLNNSITKSNSLQELATHSSLTITNESETTMNNRSLARQRQFKHPVLGEKIFEAHIKNFINGKRMHILADYTDKTVCVGYFGKHLKI